MRMLFRLTLIVLLVATGASLGAARGQLRVAGAVVLCSGGAAVVQLVDARGQPVGRTHVCPDMALSLMAAVGQPDPDVALRQGGVRNVAPVVPVVSATVRASAAVRARGPPILI